MQQVVVLTRDDNKYGSKGHALQNVTSGPHFEDFINSQKKVIDEHGTVIKKGLTDSCAVQFRSETAHILNYSNPHNACHMPDTTHLVVGYVQSGKTMSFTGLMALALDNGYRIVIVLAGTKLNLRTQTSERLRKDLIGKNSDNNDFYKIHMSPTKDDIEDIIGHLESSDKPIIIIPLLKHYQQINRLTEIFQNTDFKDAMKEESVLIVDDEADQASLNSYGRKNSIEEGEEELSSTYRAILKLRETLPGNTYIQYTATPQANLLINIQDLLSPDSHTLLYPGEGYIGGKLFFGKGKNHSLFNGSLIKEIPPEDVFHKKRNPLTRMPQSLKDALMLHIMAVIIITKIIRPRNIRFLSMMVHPDNTNEWNKIFKKWIDAELKNWRKILSEPDGQDDKVDLLEQFKKNYPIAIEHYDNDPQLAFSNVSKYIKDIINDKKTYLVNSDKDANTHIEWNNYKMHILVGAEMLNRGFTVENLATTYMPRYNTGVSNADTIEQRCRFFGYKEDYIKSCLVFLPKISIENYYNYIDHEEELRSLLGKCSTLTEVEHAVLLSDKLRPSRLNVLPKSIVSNRLKGTFALQAFEDEAIIRENIKTSTKFIENHDTDFDIYYTYTTKDRTHRGFKLSVDEAITFLADFHFGNYRDSLRKTETIRYLRYLSSDDMEKPLRYVYFIQMAYNSQARERSFDIKTRQFSLNTRLFAGPSSATDKTDYPGDVKIIGNDSITIQLHHLSLKFENSDIRKEAYTLAVNYPEDFAVSYISNGSIDDDD